jgi:hypothetical protein
VTDRIVNTHTGRAAVIYPFGVALYEGWTRDGYFKGEHYGIVEEPEEAEIWVNGGPLAKSFIKIYPSTSIRVDD